MRGDNLIRREFLALDLCVYIWQPSVLYVSVSSRARGVHVIGRAAPDVHLRASPSRRHWRSWNVAVDRECHRCVRILKAKIKFEFHVSKLFLVSLLSNSVIAKSQLRTRGKGNCIGYNRCVV